MIHAIVAILGGIIAASPLIISKRPTSGGFISSISEYKGYIGVALTFWGIVGIIRILSNGFAYAGGIIGTCMYIAEFVVGFLLAYELIQNYLLKNNARATEIGRNMKKGLSQYQVPAGIALIVIGVLRILF